jgi:O-antigen/teichoic acid export membrane protein
LGVLKQIGSLLSGSALGQLVGFGFMLALTHVYSPKLLGEYQTALSASMFLGTIFSLKLELPLPTLARTLVRPHVIAVARLILFQTVFYTILAAFLIEFFLPQTEGPESISAMTIYLAVIIGMLIAFNNLLRFFLISHKDFSALAVILFVQGGGRGFFQFVIQSLQSFGLFAGDIIARTLTLFMGAQWLRKRSGRDAAIERIDQGDQIDDWVKIGWVGLFRSHWRYPVWVVPSTVLNSSMEWLLIPVIATRFGFVEAGIVAVGYRILIAPNSLLGAAVADVLFARFSDLYRDNKVARLRKEFFLATGTLLSISLITFGGVGYFASFITKAIDASYIDADIYIKVLIPWFACQLVVSPLSRLIFVYEKQVYKFIFDFLVFLTLLVFSLTMKELPINDFLLYLASVMGFLYLFYYLLLVVLLYSGRPAS